MALEGNFCALTIHGAGFERVPNGAGFERVQYRSLSASTFPKPKASKIIVLATWPVLKWSLVL
jgi:hypothetical protein